MHSHDSPSSHWTLGIVSDHCLQAVCSWMLDGVLCRKKMVFFQVDVSKPPDMKTSALNTCVVKYSCPPDPLRVAVHGTGKQVPCAFPVWPALLYLGPLHGLRPSDPQNNQISPEPCLQPSPIIFANSILFHCGVYLEGFRSISTPLQLLWSPSCCLHGWRQAWGY